jgi:hypothetical protein
MKPVTFLIAGAGDRCFIYAQDAEYYPEKCR